MASPVVLAVQAPLLGTFFSSVLYGVSLMQTTIYVYHYPRDRRIFKLVVAVLCMLQTAQFALAIATIEHYLITNYNNPAALSYIPKPFVLMNALAYVTGCIVNWCFAWRIYILSEGVCISGFLAVCATARAVLSVRNCFYGFQQEIYALYIQEIHPFFLAGVTISIFVDMSIAAVTSYYLHVRRTGMARTDNLIKHLLVYTLNSGIILFLLSFLIMITFVTLQADAFTAFLQVQSEFFCISFLTSLISRPRTDSERALVPFGHTDSEPSAGVWTSITQRNPSHISYQMRPKLNEQDIFNVVDQPLEARSKATVLDRTPT